MSIDIMRVVEKARQVKPDAEVDEEKLRDPVVARLAETGLYIPLKKDPIPAVVAKLAAALLLPVAGDLVEKAVRPMTSGVDFVTKTKTYELYRGRVIDAVMNAILSTVYTPSRVDASGVNYTPEQFADLLDKIIKATILVTALVSEDAGEIVMEALQEALSNAVYAGFGGMVTSITNYRAGFAPPPGMLSQQGEEGIDPRTRALVDAFSGVNFHATAAQEMARAYSDVEKAFGKFRKLDEVARALEAASDVHGLILTRAPDFIISAFEDLLQTVKQQLMVLARRVNEIEGIARTATRDYNYGVIGEPQLQLIYDALMNELDAIDVMVDDMVADLADAVQYIPQEDEATANALANALLDLYIAFSYIIDSRIQEFKRYIQTLKNARYFTNLDNVGYYGDNNITGTRDGVGFTAGGGGA